LRNRKIRFRGWAFGKCLYVWRPCATVKEIHGVLYDMRRNLLFGHILTLLTGGLVYVSFRVDSIVMFKWFSILNVDGLIQHFRGLTLHYCGILPDWILYSLPDGLWVFSYVSIVLYVWKAEINYNNFIWVILIPLYAVIHEIGQFFQVVSGTFDSTDMLFFMAGTFMPFILFSNHITIKTTEHEQVS
jgi:hypothetical protein